MDSPNRTPLILVGALLLVLGAGALLLVRAPRSSAVAPPGTVGLRTDSGSEELSPAETVGPEAAPKREDGLAGRVEEEPPATVLPDLPPVASPFRGRVVDAATGEPVALTRMVAGPLEAEVDAEGRWLCDEPLPEHVQQVEFHDPEQGTHIRTVRRDQLEETRDGWLARIAVGPTYRLRIVDATGAPVASWRARLVELAADGAESRGSWIKLHPTTDGTPFLRYDNPWEPDAPGSRFRVDVRDDMATRGGSSGLLASAVGIYPEVVPVPIDLRLSTAQGRVVDVAGNPKKSARLIAAPIDADGFAADSTEEAELWPTVHSDGDGSYRFHGLLPGSYRIHVRPRRGETPQSRTVLLPPGESTLDDFVFAVQEGAGMIEGKLKSRRGLDFEHKESVRLRAVDGRDFELLDISSSGGPIQSPLRRHVRAQGNEGEHVFEFNEVPAGQYELSVVAQDGYEWTPRFAKAEPPNDELVFWREDDVPHRSYVIEVFDEETGERIERFTVQHQIGSTWNAEVVELSFGDSLGPYPAQATKRWTVHAAGYVPAWRPEPREDADTRLRFELTPGFGFRLILRDLGHGFDSDDEDGRLAAATRPPIAGAKIFLGDLYLDETPANGIVTLSGARNREDRITIQAPGWRVVESDRFREGRVLGPARDVVVWMIRE